MSTPPFETSCPQGFFGKDCLLPIVNTGPGSRRFMVELDVSFNFSAIGARATHTAAELISSINISSHLAIFFSATMGSVEVAETSSRRTSNLAITAKITVRDDHDVALRQLATRRALLEQFLSYRTSSNRRSANTQASVPRMQLTCGEGHEPSTTLAACKPCNRHHHKASLDNSTCSPCPQNSFTTSDDVLLNSVDFCRCAGPSRPAPLEDDSIGPNGAQASVVVASDSSASYWIGRLECVDEVQTIAPTLAPANETLSDELVQTVQNTLTPVVAGAVVAAITTSVVSASGPGLSASGSGGSSMATITQVQMLNQVGRMGGGRSSSGLSSATSGFGWSNYNPRNVGVAGFLGRSKQYPDYCTNYSASNGLPEIQAKNASIPSECDLGCGWDRGAPSVEQLVLCVLCLFLVSLARIFFSLVVQYVLKRELSASMQFPMWEGPGTE